MKLRNYLLALACLAAFVAIGYFYVRMWVVQKPFGIILFVSDGLVSRHLTTARMYEGGADHSLAIEAFPHTALLRNSARDFAVPDDASAATALATGVRTNHRLLAMDPDGRSLRSITAIARQQGRSIGIVTNGRMASPTPAAFYAHSMDASDGEQIAQQFVDTFRPDVAFGGGLADFLPQAHGGRRKDGRDMVAELQGKGCEFLGSKAELENASSYRRGGVVGLFAPGPLAFGDQIEAASQQPSLSDMVRRAVTFLQQNGKGYLLIVDAALVGSAAERNEGERAITETLALDRAIATATKYAGSKALILAVGRHSTGGMSLNGYPLREDRGVALLGNNASGYPYLTWATGPNGPAPASPPTLSPSTPEPANAGSASARPKNQPAAFQTPSGLNNAEDVLAVGRGSGSERLSGFMDSTAIFGLIKDAL